MWDEELKKFVGRTVESITRYGDEWIVFQFDDGTILSVKAFGNEDSWLELESLG